MEVFVVARESQARLLDVRARERTRQARAAGEHRHVEPHGLGARTDQDVDEYGRRGGHRLRPGLQRSGSIRPRSPDFRRYSTLIAPVPAFRNTRNPSVPVSTAMAAASIDSGFT